MPSFFRPRQHHTRVPTDDIITVHILDDNPVFKIIIPGWTIRIAGGIDARKTYEALETLFSRDGWRKLGGRVRRNAAGKLELHVPAKFTRERPAVRFSHFAYDVCINDYPLASRLPVATSGPSLGGSTADCPSLVYPYDSPRNLEDYLCSDNPLFALHIISFTDATLVSLSWLHIAADALGLGFIVRNWMHVLADREDQVQPFVGYRNDPMGVFNCDKVELDKKPWMLTGSILTGLSRLVFLGYYSWKFAFGPKVQTRVLCIPAKTIAGLMERAAADLVSEKEKRNKHPNTPFVSEGDVLAAWTAKIIADAYGKNPFKTVTIRNSFDVRARLPSVFDRDVAYVQNLVDMIYISTTVLEIGSLSLGRLALRFRESLAEQLQPEDIAALMRLQMRSAASGQPLLVGKLTSLMANWSRAKLGEFVDLSPAVAGEVSNATTSAAGKPVALYSMTIGGAQLLRETVNVLGKDVAGNCWCVLYANPAVMKAVKGEIRLMERGAAAGF